MARSTMPPFDALTELGIGQATAAEAERRPGHQLPAAIDVRIAVGRVVMAGEHASQGRRRIRITGGKKMSRLGLEPRDSPPRVSLTFAERKC